MQHIRKQLIKEVPQLGVPEILAPAGGQEQLAAAVRCGADAVYLGTEHFNARRSASNFGPEALAAAGRYCRERGVKLYVTVNTLIRGRELPALEEEADIIAEAGADAVILQDPAAAILFAKRYPHIHRAASTQTAVHNVDGVHFLEDAGFDSFVLARELSLEEMEKIISSTALPAEAFVHGAHCMSVSGMCLLSAVLGGRSGNRGMCAQPCRLNWRCGEEEHALSLKDMSLIRHIPELARIGVHTLKIEGRMKRPEYAAAAVTACRAAREGEPWDEETLQKVFSRSGFTDGYLTGERGRQMYGFRTKEDVTGADAVLGSIRELYRHERQSVPVRMTLKVTEETSVLEVYDGDHSVAISGPAPQKAVSKPLDAAAAKERLSRTGGTQYYVNLFSGEIVPDVMLPAAGLNAMRRDALAQLDALRGARELFVRCGFDGFDALETARKKKNTGALWARFRRADGICGEEALEKILLPAEEITPSLAERYGAKLVAELPAVCFPDDEYALRERLKKLRDCGAAEVWTDNIYGIAMAGQLGFGIHGGSGLNAANLPAAVFFAEKGLLTLTASVEITMAELRRVAETPIPVGMIAYGHIPLMRFRNCPIRAFRGCVSCGGKASLVDRKGVAFPVECGQKRYSSLLNSVPLDMSGRECPCDFRVLWFTAEPREETQAVIRRFLRGEKTTLPHTTGLYARGVE